MMQIQQQYSKRLAWLGMLAVLCLLVLLNYSSNGGMRTLGEDEDGGSGFGGTGRTQAPGSESGLGGTGLRPFLGVDQSSNAAGKGQPGEIKLLISPTEAIQPLLAQRAMPADSSAPKLEKPLPRSIAIEIGDPVAEAAGSIHISEAIQREVDINALTVNSNSINREPSAAPRSGLVADLNDPALPASESEHVSWASLAKVMAENPIATGTRSEEFDAAAPQQPEERAARPRSIQRPVLPPLQRVRPIQRAGLLPPPIRPLRL